MFAPATHLDLQLNQYGNKERRLELIIASNKDRFNVELTCCAQRCQSIPKYTHRKVIVRIR